MGNAGKAIVAALYALAVVAVPLFEGNHVPNSTEWTQIVIAALTAVAVYIVPLTSEYPWIKSAIGALLAGAQILVTVVSDGLNGNDVLMIVFAIAAALGIVLAPAASGERAVARVGWGSDSLLHPSARLTVHQDGDY